MLPVIATFALVKNEVLPEEIWPTIQVLEVAMLAAFLVLWLCLRNPLKAGIVCSAGLAMCFCYRMIACAVDNLYQVCSGAAAAPAWVLLTGYFAMTIIFLAFTTKEKWKFGKHEFTLPLKQFNNALNVVSFVLIILNVVPICIYEYQVSEDAKKFVAQFETNLGKFDLDQNAPKPDIYYFIFDGMANPLTLKDLTGYEDKEFIPFLKAKGFYVVPHAASNYDRTEFSITSSTNMQYVDLIPQTRGADFNGLVVYFRAIQDSCVPRILKRLGYKFVCVASGSPPSDYIPNADVNLRCIPFNHFSIVVALLTPLAATETYYPLLTHLLGDLRLCPGHCLDQILSIKGPKFVLIHTDLAHAPNIFDENGNVRTMPLSWFLIAWGPPDQYVSQWIYAQRQATSWLAKILDHPGPKPIILVQSDHGPGIDMKEHHKWNQQRMRILNAYYFPGLQNKGLYESITPVNSFRVLFNDYFHAGLPILQDRVNGSDDYAHPYPWKDITKEMTF